MACTVINLGILTPAFINILWVYSKLSMAITLYIFPPPFSLSFTSFPPEIPPWESNRSHSLLCCIAFARGFRETAENLYRYSRPFNIIRPQSTVSEEMTSRSACRCAGHGPAVTNPSNDLAPSYLTWMITWHRTPIIQQTLSVSFLYIFSHQQTKHAVL